MGTAMALFNFLPTLLLLVTSICLSFAYNTCRTRNPERYQTTSIYFSF